MTNAAQPTAPAYIGHIHGVTVVTGFSRAEVARVALARGIGRLEIVPIHPSTLEAAVLDAARTAWMTERDILWQIAECAMGGFDVYLQELADDHEADRLVEACFERIDEIERRDGVRSEPDLCDAAAGLPGGAT